MYFLRQFASINNRNKLIVQRLGVSPKSNDLNVERLGLIIFKYIKMNFGINSPIKIFSKQLNNKNFSNFKNKILNVTGFCDSESSFSISIYQNNKLKTG